MDNDLLWDNITKKLLELEYGDDLLFQLNDRYSMNISNRVDLVGQKIFDVFIYYLHGYIAYKRVNNRSCHDLRDKVYSEILKHILTGSL